MGDDELHEGVSGSAAAPTHEVSLEGYWIAKTQTTKGQFRAFVDATGYLTSVEQSGHEGSWVYSFDDQGFVTIPGHSWRNAFHQVTERFPEITVDDSHPVVNVSWVDSVAFCDWLARTIGVKFVLPTEAEWEYAARGKDERSIRGGMKTQMVAAPTMPTTCSTSTSPVPNRPKCTTESMMAMRQPRP